MWTFSLTSCPEGLCKPGPSGGGVAPPAPWKKPDGQCRWRPRSEGPAWFCWGGGMAQSRPLVAQLQLKGAWVS